MDNHTAHVFVGDVIFNLTGTVLASHLWNMVPLSDVGVSAKLLPELAKELGISQENLSESTTLEKLGRKVESESILPIKVVTEPFPFFF